MERITIDEFVQRTSAALEAWAAATRSAQAEGVEGFVGDRFERRTETDWWREVAAYHEYVELQERVSQDRRSNVERRGVK